MGLRLLSLARQRNPENCVILLTTSSPDDIELATEAMRLGAYDFQMKPWNLEKIAAVIEGMDPELKARCWNSGEERPAGKSGRLLIPVVTDKPAPGQPVLTQIQNYKREVRAVGIDHFKIRRSRGG